MLQPSRRSLWDLVAPEAASPTRFLADPLTRILVRDLADSTTLSAKPETLRGLSVMISTDRQLLTALSLIELDGIARRIVLCTPDLSPAFVQSAMIDGEVDVVVTDGGGPTREVDHTLKTIRIGTRLRETHVTADRSVDTEWILFTSGTTGRPKLAMHTLTSLVGPLVDNPAAGRIPVWSTFYDIRRYGGLQIMLRALAGGGSQVFSSATEPVADFLKRAGECGVTHISGTPSHWRRALMSGATASMAPDYVRLSGEACDQAILDSLQRAYPHANVAHAFASTEAGVAFDVRDGKAGFPAALIDANGSGVEMRVEDGSLRIRSSRTAARYLGDVAPALSNEVGFIDTGDLLELRGDRYYFIGRREGIINVGGQKVHPEAVEAVINEHPAVSVSRVSARKNPITGAIVVAEIVLSAKGTAEDTEFQAIVEEIRTLCHERLDPHQVPVTFREVSSIDVAASGKLVRTRA
jgi:acyl-coenzyme A synthetase/AMP-(fatty) acid ligase